MAGFDELKQLALDAAEAIADKSVELYKAAEEKTKTLAKTAKLNAEITKEKSNVKKHYTELGSLYYYLYKDTPDERLQQLCEEITTSLEYIELKQSELDELRAQPDVEVEFVQADEEPAADKDECSCCCGCDPCGVPDEKPDADSDEDTSI